MSEEKPIRPNARAIYNIQKERRENAMSNEKNTFVSPPPEADGNYRYCCIADFIPVRVTLDEKGRDDYITEAPDPENNGQLHLDMKHMITIFKDEDVEDITKEKFIELCKNYMSTRSTYTIAPKRLDHN
jgi:hypothetical protein